MKTTAKKIIYRISALLILVLLSIGIWWGGFTRSAFADTSSGNLDNTNVLDDLKGMVIDGKPFDVNDYTYTPFTQTDVIMFAESCYGYYESSRSDYNLYIYVWNPQHTAYELESELNYIEFTTEENGEYEKYPIEYLNMSTSGLFYKYKVILTDTQKSALFTTLMGEERYYHVSGIELKESGELNATEYTVNKEYVYSGYAAGYGADPEAESTLTFTQEVGETLALDVHTTYYRAEGSNGKSDYTRDSLHSAYFSIPNDILEKYGSLSAVKATWRDAVLAPTLVITEDMYTRDYMKRQLDTLLGVNIGQFYEDDSSLSNTEQISQYMFAFGAASISLGVFNGSYHFYYNLDTDSSANLCPRSMSGAYTPWVVSSFVSYSEDVFGSENITAMTDDIFLDTLNMYLVADTDDLEDYEFSSGTLQDKMLELSNGKYADYEKVNEKYAVNLFSSVAEEYTVLETLDSTVIENFTSGTLKTGWDSFWSSLTGGSQWNYEYEDLQALYEVQPEDITGNAETDCKKLYIAESDYSEFKAFYDSAVSNDEAVFLLRYQQTDYEAMEGEIYDRNSEDEHDWYEIDGFNSYIFQETVNLDFDIIQLSYSDGSKTTVMPVVSDPIDNIPEPDSPEIFDDEDGGCSGSWQTILMILALLVLLIICLPILPYIVQFVVWLISLPFKLIGAIIKGIKKAAKKKPKDTEQSPPQAETNPKKKKSKDKNKQ